VFHRIVRVLYVVGLVFAPMLASTAGDQGEEQSTTWLSKTVRVFVESGGTEHVLSRVSIEWLSSSPGGEGRQALATATLNIGYASCGVARRLSESRFSIRCTDVHGPGAGTERRYVVTVGGPGDYAVLEQ
jgi:hypothetical protein